MELPGTLGPLATSCSSEATPAPRWNARLRLGLTVLALVYALLAGLKTVVDFDLGWQMATGRYLLTHHVLPRTELFSYTARGVEWIYPVLSGVLFDLLHQIGGYAAISWLCALTTVACAALLVVGRGLGAVVLGVLAVPVLASEVMPRASLFTMLLFAAFARILLEHFESRVEEGRATRRARLWLLPVLMLLWVNLHTGFIAGLALLAAYLLVELLETPFADRRAAALARMRRALPWLLATVAVTLCNPWGVRIFVAIARQQAVTRWQSAFLEEWAPVQLASALQELGWRTPDSARWWLLAVGLVLALVCLVRRRLGPAVVLAIATFAFLQHQRMEGPSILLICLIGGSVLDHARSPRLSIAACRGLALAGAALLTALVAVRCSDLVTDRVYLSNGEITLFGTGPSWWLPEQATAFLREHHLPGNVFSSFNLSSYLVWRTPEYPDFSDGRYVPFGEALFERQRMLSSLPLDAPQWAEAAATYHIDTVILPVARIFGLNEPPLLADCQSHTWTPVYLDTTAVLFVRNAALAPAALQALAIDCRTYPLLPSDAAAPPATARQRAEQYQRLANATALYSTLGRIPEAQQAADRAAALFPDDPTLLFVRAQTAVAAHQYDEAEQELLTALALRSTDAGWYNLALLYLSERRLPEAVAALDRSAPLARDAYARHLLIARIQLAEQQPQAALTSLDRAARLSPYGGSVTPAATEFAAQLAENRAAAYEQLQQPAAAVAQQRLAVQQTPNDPRRRAVLAQLCQSAQTPCATP